MKSYQLEPLNGEWPTFEELVVALREDFPFLDEDKSAGEKHCQNLLELTRKLNAPKSIIEFRENMVFRAGALRIRESEDDPDGLIFHYMPEEALRTNSRDDQCDFLGRIADSIAFSVEEFT